MATIKRIGFGALQAVVGYALYDAGKWAVTKTAKAVGKAMQKEE